MMHIDIAPSAMDSGYLLSIKTPRFTMSVRNLREREGGGKREIVSRQTTIKNTDINTVKYCQCHLTLDCQVIFWLSVVRSFWSNIDCAITFFVNCCKFLCICE